MNATYTISVTIQSPYYPASGTFPYLDGGGNVANLATIQANQFTQDPDDPTKYTAVFTCGSGTYRDVTFKVRALRDADSGGNPAASASDSVTGLTIIKQ